MDAPLHKRAVVLTTPAVGFFILLLAFKASALASTPLSSNLNGTWTGQAVALVAERTVVETGERALELEVWKPGGETPEKTFILAKSATSKPASGSGPEGGAVVVWAAVDGDQGSSSLRLQRLDPAGKPDGPSSVLVAQTGWLSRTAVTFDARGEVTVAWEQKANFQSVSEVFVLAPNSRGLAIPADRAGCSGEQPALAQNGERLLLAWIRRCPGEPAEVVARSLETELSAQQGGLLGPLVALSRPRERRVDDLALSGDAAGAAVMWRSVEEGRQTIQYRTAGPAWEASPQKVLPLHRGGPGEHLTTSFTLLPHEQIFTAWHSWNPEAESTRLMARVSSRFQKEGGPTLTLGTERRRGFREPPALVSTPEGTVGIFWPAGPRIGVQWVEASSAGRRLRGTVTDQLGQPVAGASVFARPADSTDDQPLPAQLSNADGIFGVRVDRFEPVDVLVVAEGFAPLLVRRTQTASQVHEAGVVDLGTFSLETEALLEGRIEDPGGDAVQGAVIGYRRSRELPRWAQRALLSLGKREAESDPDGRFFLTGLAPGDRIGLAVHAPGFLRKVLRNVPAAQAIPLRIKLMSAARIAGLILDRSGKAVPGASVSTLPPGGLSPVQAGFTGFEATRGLSAANGSFALEGVSPDVTDLWIVAEGFVSRRKGGLEVVAGGSLEDVEIVLDRGRVIGGRVVDARGEAVAGALVSAGPGVSAATTEDGSFSLSSLPERDLRVTAQHPESRYLRTTVDVGPGMDTVELRLPAGVAVRGRVVDQGGLPVEAAKIKLIPKRGPGSDATTDAWGRFELQGVPLGSYRLRAESTGGTASLDFEVATELSELLVLRLRATGAVAGTIEGVEANDFANLMVNARRAEFLDREARVAHDGTFLLEGMAAGAWEVAARLAGSGRAAQATVDLAPGETSPVVLTFGEGSRLSVTALLNGEPLRGLAFLQGSSGTRASTEPDLEGGLVFSNLAEGSYDLRLSSLASGLVFVLQLSLEADRHIFLDLETTSFQGEILDTASGEPLPGAWAQLKSSGELRGEPWTSTSGLVRTDSHGTFVIPETVVGPSLAQVGAVGYQTAYTRAEIVPQAFQQFLLRRPSP